MTASAACCGTRHNGSRKRCGGEPGRADRRPEGTIRDLACGVLPRAGSVAGWYYKWCRGDRSPRRHRRKALAANHRVVIRQAQRTYGSPRITGDLRDMGWRVSKNTGATLMAGQGLLDRRKRRRRGSTSCWWRNCGGARRERSGPGQGPAKPRGHRGQDKNTQLHNGFRHSRAPAERSGSDSSIESPRISCAFLYTSELLESNPMPLVGRPKVPKSFPKRSSRRRPGHSRPR